MKSNPGHMIVDVHVHAYGDAMRADPVGWARQQGENYWADLIAPDEKGFSLQGWASREETGTAMKAAGVDHAVLQGWYWQKQSTCDRHNEELLSWVQAAPERYSAFATAQPTAGRAALRSLERAIDSGLCGIGEIHPGVQGFARDDATWLDILAFAEERELPVLIHVTEPVGRPYRGRTETPLPDFVFWAERFPRLRMVLAHWGGGLPIYERSPYIREGLRNVYYDTAASPLVYDPEIWRVMEACVGREKILFGSDYPLRLYPRQDRSPGWERLLTEVREAGLSLETERAWLGANAADLFGIGSRAIQP